MVYISNFNHIIVLVIYMNLKKLKVINVIVVFLLSFLAHEIYNWFPNTLTSIFFPVNESIWEHMKIFATCFIFYGIFEFFLLRHFRINFSNYLLSLFLSSVAGIIFYLIIYIPIYFFISRSMFFTIGLMLVTYIVMNIVSYYILKKDKIPYLENLSIIFIIALYLVFGFFTYNPSHNFLFFDTVEERYGINEYIM